MLKNGWLFLVSLLLAGCASQLTSQFTNLTPLHQTRNATGMYRVEVVVNSVKQALVWESIQPRVMIGETFYDMAKTPLLPNRWEALIPVPAGESILHYRYKFDYEQLEFGRRGRISALSPQYTLQLMD